MNLNCMRRHYSHKSIFFERIQGIIYANFNGSLCNKYKCQCVYSGPISTTNSGANGTSIPDETEPLILN